MGKVIMKRIINALAIIGLGFSSYSYAAGSSINITCPSRINAKIITPLPKDFWTTTQASNLKRTFMGKMGNKTVLFCEYSVYSSKATVQRYIPKGMKRCKLNATGFTCTSAAPPSSNRRKTELSISYPRQYNLDAGARSTDETGDVWLTGTPSRRGLKPINNATITRTSSAAACSTAQKSNAPIPDHQLVVGKFLCVKTNSNRNIVLEITRSLTHEGNSFRVRY